MAPPHTSPCQPDFVPFIIDVEASGLGSQSYPIEVGVAMEPGQRYSVLVAPAPGWTHWDQRAEQVHRIPRDILAEHGKPVHVVAAELNARLQGMRLYTDAWVVDRPWLSALFHAARTRMAFDISPIEAIFTEAQMSLWDEVKTQVLAETDMSRHRASHDAMLIQQMFVRSRQQTMRHTNDVV